MAPSIQSLMVLQLLALGISPAAAHGNGGGCHAHEHGEGEEYATKQGDPWFALLLTFLAGFATTIGAALTLCVDMSNGKAFATCLAIAAGVMTYISFIEIIPEAKEKFCDSGLKENDAETAAVLTFFAGIVISFLMDKISAKVHDHMHAETLVFRHGSAEDVLRAHSDPDMAGLSDPMPDGRTTREVDLDQVRALESGQGESQQNDVAAANIELPSEDPSNLAVNEDLQVQQEPLEGKERLNILQMAVFSGIAIALHNFPEGVATFVGTIANPDFGPLMAFAIAVHNIPEGVVVAAPILKATGSRSKAFLWSFLSGMSEPLGGVLAWLVLKDAMGPMTFAILFGLVAGIMVYICFKKLLPNALKYDHLNKVTSGSFICGMAIMAASLMAFSYR